MKRTKLEKATFLAMLLGALLACKSLTGGGDDDKGKSDKSDESAESSGGGDKIGVKECDEYISKFEKCIESSTAIPTEAKKAQMDAFKQTRDAWREAAKTPGGKAGLKMGCEQALKTAKESMKAYNCEW
jgi:hypothetical protein